MAARAATGFPGWPTEAIQFLRELEDNNDRDWFKANRARYDEHVVAPTMALAEELGDLGRPHLFRPWNDTRYRPGPPIKEQVGLAIGHEGPAASTSSCRSTDCWWPRACTCPRPTSSSGCALQSTHREPRPRSRARYDERPMLDSRSTSPSSCARRAGTSPITRGWNCCAGGA
ncbi:MAG: hypothetical protein QOK04_1143 [Solirubrobacteraceae bacterium]|nr:hypothetical protein [Solirubrobacteraceae bacterium]